MASRLPTMTTLEAERGLRRYEDIELERVRELARSAVALRDQGATVRELVLHMFDLERNPPQQAPLLGEPASLLPLARRTALTIWPEAAREDGKVQGIPLEDLVDYIESGLIVPLAQNPAAYSRNPALASLVCRFRPASYFFRGNALYSILAGGDARFKKVGSSIFSGPALKWNKAARKLKEIRDSPAYRDAWEPMHRRKLSGRMSGWEQEYIFESFVFKYTNACVFLGQDFVESVRREIECSKFLRFLTVFHIFTDHPISHALLCGATIRPHGADWAKFESLAGDYYSITAGLEDVTSVPLKLWARPSYALHAAMLDAGCEPVIDFDALPLGDADMREISNFRSDLALRAAEYNAFSRKVAAAALPTKAVFAVTSVLSSGLAAVAGGGAASILTAFLLPILGSTPLVDYTLNRLRAARLDSLLFKVFDEHS